MLLLCLPEQQWRSPGAVPAVTGTRDEGKQTSHRANMSSTRVSLSWHQSIMFISILVLRLTRQIFIVHVFLHLWKCTITKNNNVIMEWNKGSSLVEPAVCLVSGGYLASEIQRHFKIKVAFERMCITCCFGWHVVCWNTVCIMDESSLHQTNLAENL